MKYIYGMLYRIASITRGGRKMMMIMTIMTMMMTTTIRIGPIEVSDDDEIEDN